MSNDDMPEAIRMAIVKGNSNITLSVLSELTDRRLAGEPEYGYAIHVNPVDYEYLTDAKSNHYTMWGNDLRVDPNITPGSYRLEFI